MTIVDVRTPQEFMGGHVANSINIPLQEIREHIDEIRSMPKPLILCCASGGRSGSAAALLQSMGIDCENGGGWMSINARVRD